MSPFLKCGGAGLLRRAEPGPGRGTGPWSTRFRDSRVYQLCLCPLRCRPAWPREASSNIWSLNQRKRSLPRTMTMILWTMRPPGWRAYHLAGTRFSTLPVGSLTTGMRTQTSYPGFPHMTPTLWLPNRPRSSEAVMQMLKKSWTGAMTSRTGAMTSRTAAMRNQTGATTSQTGATTNLTGIESVAMTSKSKG
ncbi:polyglutamine-binding protein 1 isoform X7 [Macaca fascicularis]|uniref:polyglutamine-binding protein 1 isoform X7 n=1 Tax=Macaca fascicularis TaxID=9541 RepID=UPI003D15BB3C